MYRRIAAGIMRNIDFKTVFSDEILDSLIEKGLNSAIDMFSSEDFQKVIIPYLDGLYERYKNKAFNAIGGAMKGVNAEVAQANPLQILGKGGKINWMTLIQMYISRGQHQPYNQPQNTSSIGPAG